jgi:hypothetical protein
MPRDAPVTSAVFPVQTIMATLRERDIGAIFSPQYWTGGVALLCVPTIDVNLEFLGGVSEPSIVDVAVQVAVDCVHGLA